MTVQRSLTNPWEELMAPLDPRLSWGELLCCGNGTPSPAVSQAPTSARIEAPLSGTPPRVSLHLAVNMYPLLNW